MRRRPRPGWPARGAAPDLLAEGLLERDRVALRGGGAGELVAAAGELVSGRLHDDPPAVAALPGSSILLGVLTVLLTAAAEVGPVPGQDSSLTRVFVWHPQR